MSEAKEPTPAPAPSLVSQVRQNSRHPKSVLFHVLFKVLAIIMWFMPMTHTVTKFAIVITLLAFDFWTVKNVTGRLLVGLRYWNKINDDGSSEWVFESLDDPSIISPSDARFFWTVLISYPIIWVALVFLRAILFIGLDTYVSVLSVIAIIFGTTNAVGYIRCRRDAKKKVAGYLASKAFAHASKV
ncbi:hypothetical protein GEMRC1_004037 [Eukaryota sp. GEM-RC1]